MLTFYISTLPNPQVSKKMAAVNVAAEIYNQYDFIPSDYLAFWQASGNSIGNILEWLEIPVNLANALLTTIGQ